jgi:hypothetical protein
MTLSRRRFLQLAGSATLAATHYGWLEAQDWDHETRMVIDIRERLQAVIGALNMALDFRSYDAAQNELFRIQIKADQLLPVASCFKAFIVPYYFLNTPPEDWDFGEDSLLYSMAVHSNNGATGTVLDTIARHVRGDGNAIVKFNDFLNQIGLQNGLHTWNWEGSPTAGMTDPRYAPSQISGRVVRVRGQIYSVDNVVTAVDLARGHDFITRGEYFTSSEQVRQAIHQTKTLLAIPSIITGYESPIERVFPPGYVGKDGILPASDIQTGRVVNDAGALRIGDRTYIIAFMSAGESEAVALNVLREVVNQMDVFEQANGGASLEVLFNGT